MVDRGQIIVEVQARDWRPGGGLTAQFPLPILSYSFYTFVPKETRERLARLSQPSA